MKKLFYARYYLLILAGFIFLTPVMLAGTRRAIQSNNNDVKAWLPEGYPETADLHWFQEHFGGDEFVLVSWKGCTLDDPRLDLLVRKLLDPEQKGDRYFRTAMTGPSALAQLTTPPVELSYEEALDRLHGALIGPDGRQTCAVFVVTDLGKQHRHQLLEQIRRVAEQECNVPRDDLHMGGPPVDNVAVDVEGQRTLMRLAGLSGLVGLGLTWWCLRRIHFVWIVMLIGVYSAGLSLAIVWYTGATMDAVLFSMPSLVYVLAMSGAIHIINYYREAVRSHGVDGAPELAIRHAIMPAGLAACTTAIGLGSLLISELVPVQKFGGFSALGVLASLGVLLLMLPALLQAFPLKDNGQEDKLLAREHRWDAIWDRVGGFIMHHNAAICVVMLSALAVAGFGLTRVKTSVNLLKLFSDDARIIQDYAWLEENLGALIPLEIVLEFDPEKTPLNFTERLQVVEAVQRRIEEIPQVGSSLSAATFAPDISPPERRSGGIGGAASTLLGGQRTWRNVTEKRLLRHRQEFIDSDYLADSDNLELWRISVRVGAQENMDYVDFVDGVQDEVDPVLAGVAGVRPVYTGLMPVVYKAQQELFDSLFSSFMMAFGLIAIVMVILLRGIGAGLVSMIPNVFPAVMIFGAMGWGSVLIDIGSMMTASVAMGVAVDDTIHFLTWFRRGLAEGYDRSKAIMYAYGRCANAMMQTTIIAGFGLSVFAFSTFKPTQRFGVIMLAMLIAAVVGDLILMPALLASPLGRFFEKKRKRQRKGELLERWPVESEAAASSASLAVAPHRVRHRADAGSSRSGKRH